MRHGTMVGQRPTRLGLVALDGFLGVTAALGGLGLLLGLPLVSPPTELLAGSPFSSYLVPGLTLLALVGGGGLVAAVLLARRSLWGLAASGLAGLMVLAFEAVELVVIGFTWLLACYVALGLLILALAARLWLAERGAPRSAGSVPAGGSV